LATCQHARLQHLSVHFGESLLAAGFGGGDKLQGATTRQPGGSYRIEITGEPSYAMDLCLSSRKGDHNHAGLVATAMRIVNAIPAVVAAPPGIVTTHDLPLITGRGLYVPG
jgi:hypothetical protein